MIGKNRWVTPIHRFECDKRKAISNFQKHGVRFTEGCRAFAGHTFTAPSKQIFDDTEDRYVTIGTLSSGVVAVIVWTKRGNTIRVISVRKASHTEREQFYVHIEKALN